MLYKVLSFPNRFKPEPRYYYKSLLIYRSDLDRKMLDVLKSALTIAEKNVKVIKLGRLIRTVEERLWDLEKQFASEKASEKKT